MQQSERKTDRQKVQAMQAEEKSRPRMHKPEKVILLLSSFFFGLYRLVSSLAFIVWVSCQQLKKLQKFQKP